MNETLRKHEAAVNKRPFCDKQFVNKVLMFNSLFLLDINFKCKLLRIDVIGSFFERQTPIQTLQEHKLVTKAIFAAYG